MLALLWCSIFFFNLFYKKKSSVELLILDSKTVSLAFGYDFQSFFKKVGGEGG